MDKMISDLKELVSFNSVCEKNFDCQYPFGKEVHGAVKKALEICSSYGFKTVDKKMTAYAEVGQGDSLMGILVHMDIVPAGDSWYHDPFTLHIEDGKIYGRGVTDDKGPAVAVIHAIKELMEEGVTFNKKVRIIFGMSEETGQWEDMQYYKSNEEKIEFGFTPDADFPAIYGEKGIAHIKFSFPIKDTCFTNIEGGMAVNMVPDFCSCKYIDENGQNAKLSITGKAAHGSTPEDGENAISKMMIHFAKNGKCKLSQFFKQCISMEFNGKKLGGYYEDKISGPITYNLGKIETINDTINLLVDVRYPVTCDINKTIDCINENLREKGFDIQAELISNTPYVYMDKDGEVITKLLEAYREHTGDNSEPTVIGGGTYARAMEDIVAFGPMLPNRELTEHQANEYIYMEDLKLAKEIYKTALKKLATD